MAAFFEYVQFQARSNPTFSAIVAPKAVVSYSMLVQHSLAVAAELAAQGLKPGDIIALHILNPELHCCAILGAPLIGVTTLTLQQDRNDLPQNLSIAAVVADQPFDTPAQVRIISASPAWLKSATSRDRLSIPIGHDDGPRIARILCTSGTTGEQKAVPYSEEQLLQRAWSQAATLRPELGQARVMSGMGLASGVGFTNMMLTLMTGGTLFHGWAQFQIPKCTLLYRLERLLVSTNQLNNLVIRALNQNASFPSLKSVIVGGSHIPQQLAQRGAAYVCRNLICLYGATELGVVATAPSQLIAHNKSAVGYIVPGIEVEAVDEQDNVLGPGVEGILRMRVPGAPDRYLNDSEASKKAFRNGWFYCGDVGSVSADKLLFVSGRLDDRINAGGVKVAPHVIEDAIRARVNVLDIAAFEYTNSAGITEIGVAIVTEKKINSATLKEFCSKQLHELAPKHFVPLKEIPRNENGKIDKPRLQQMAIEWIAAVAYQPEQA
jgi:acyl-CoA synthetase (AMP-forming)/AMP-acid ligase II